MVLLPLNFKRRVIVLLYDVAVLGSLVLARSAVTVPSSFEVRPRASLLFSAFIVHCQVLKVAFCLSLQHFFLQVTPLNIEKEAKGDALDS